MVNLLAGKALVTELMQNDFNGPNLAAQVEYLLDHPEVRDKMVEEFRALKARLGPGGALERAADAVMGVLRASGATLPTA